MYPQVNFEGAKKRVITNYVSALKTKTRPFPMGFFGSPGLGKTYCVRDAAKAIAEKMNYEFIDWAQLRTMDMSDRIRYVENIAKNKEPFIFLDLNLQTMEPVDLSGAPHETISLDGKRVTEFLPPDWVVYLQKYKGVLFLDEVTNIQRKDMQSVMLKLTQEGLAGESKINDEILIVMAGNKANETALANILPLALINRMMLFDFKAPSPEEWYEYIKNKHQTKYSSEIPFESEIAAYLSYLTSKISVPEEESQQAFVSPRSCENLYDFVTKHKYLAQTEDLDKEELYELVNDAARGFIGNKEGILFSQMFKQAFLLEDMVKKGLTEQDLERLRKNENNNSIDVGTLYALSALVAKQFSSITKEEQEKILKQNMKILFSNAPEVINVFLQESDIFTKDSYFDESIEKLARIRAIFEEMPNKDAYNKYIKPIKDVINRRADKFMALAEYICKQVDNNKAPAPIFEKPEDACLKRIIAVSQNKCSWLLKNSKYLKVKEQANEVEM